MATGKAVYFNADLESYILENTDSVALDHRKFVAFHKATGKQGGMVDLADGAAGAVAGVICDRGMDTSGFASLDNIPVGQRSRVQHRGITQVRAAAVAILPGDLVYAVTATGLASNSSAGATLVGVALTETGGTLDEMVTVDLRYI